MKVKNAYKIEFWKYEQNEM